MSRKKTGHCHKKAATGDYNIRSPPTPSRRSQQRSQQSWRANAIDPDTLPVACQPCRCHKRQRPRGSGQSCPYSLRQRGSGQRKREDISIEEIARDLRKRIVEIPIPGRGIPRHSDVPHLSHELKLRLAMVSEEVKEEVSPEEGRQYSYRRVRPEDRVVEIQDEIGEEGDGEVTLKIRVNNIKKAELWKLSSCLSK